MEERLIKVGITHGDINGIGYEVILKTFSDTRMAELCTPIIYGSYQDSRLSPEGIGASSYQYEYYFTCGGCRSKPGEHY